MKFVFALNAFICFAVCRVSAQAACPRTKSNPRRFCKDACVPSKGCSDPNKICICDGKCGYSCIPKERYRRVGCFHDGTNSAFPSILTVTTNVQECYKLAVSSGYKVFAFKFGQICMSGKGMTIATFARRKISNQCRNGRGHFTAVDVYEIAAPQCKPIKNVLVKGRANLNETHASFSCDAGYTLQGPKIVSCINGSWTPSKPSFCIEIYRHVGCFHDGASPAFPNILAVTTNVQKCYKSAVSSGYKVFAFRFGQICMSGKGVTVATFARQKQSNQCRNGLGHLAAVDVYEIVPQCKPINVLVNGSVNLNGTHASFSCDAGYTLRGPKIVSCLNGSWTPSKLSVCREIYRHAGCFQDGANSVLSHSLGLTTNVQECYKLAVSSGYKVFAFKLGQICVSGKGVTIATFARQKKSKQCRNGLGHLGAVDVYGIANKESCPRPPNATGRSFQGNDFSHGKYITFRCSSGFTINGTKSLRCSDGQWSHNFPVCRAKDCGPLSVPRNGKKLSEDKTTFGGTIKFQCDEQLGYELKGSKQRTCQGNGTWSGVQTTCQLLSCGDPGAIPNGRHIATNGNFYLSSVRYECNRGYTLQGRRSIICQKDKTWSDAAPKCYKSCPRPPNANGRSFHGNDFSHGKHITFRCSSGFTMDGTKNLRCSDGLWSHNFPVCRAPCRNPGSPTKGAITRPAYSYRHGERATFYCYRGYKLVGTKEINCFDGNWGRFQIPKCIAECKHPGDVIYGQRAGDNFLDGNIVRFRCNWNYDLFGSSSIFCNKGKWNATRPSCHRRCTNPGGIRNGNKKGTNYKHGDSVVYSCSRDYVLDGRGTLRCSYGSWNYQVPRCQAPCRPPLTPRNGGIHSRKSSYLHGQKVSLYCSNGYLLVGSSSRWCNNGRWSSRTPSCKDCDQPLGMQSKKIPNSHITASNVINGASAHFARLRGTRAWCTRKNAYLQIHLGTRHRLTTIAAQGSYWDMVNLIPYKVGYKYGNRWKFYRKVIPGNNSDSKVNTYRFKKAIETTTVRIYPQNGAGSYVACYRIELYGCRLT